MRETRVTIWLGLSTVLTAIAASLCCILPLGVAVLGAGSAALGTRLAPWRPLFLVATVALLGFAFYREYRRSAASAEEACCRPEALRRRRSMLWIITVFILALSAFPYYMPADPIAGPAAGGGTAGSGEVAHVAFRVEGMSCSGCETPAENALKQLPGVVSVKVSYDESRADVSYRPSQIGVPAMQKAIEKLGYTAERVALPAAGTEPASARPAAVSGTKAPGRQAAALRDLKGLEDLEGVFRQTRGQPRLVLLLSPT